MNSAPHLLDEDRAEYERLLDDALRMAPGHSELAPVGGPLNREQLRTMALNATALITAAAAAEYDHYVKVRNQVTRLSTAYSSPNSPSAPATAAAGPGRRLRAAVLGAGDGEPEGRRATGEVPHRRWVEMSYGRRLLAALLGMRVRPEGQPQAAQRPRTAKTPSAAERRHSSLSAYPSSLSRRRAGAGVFATFVVIGTVLSGVAALVFLAVGLLLKALDTGSTAAQVMVTGAWLFGTMTAVGLVIAVLGVVVTALRNDAEAPPPDVPSEGREEVARAREAWRRALLERGLLPFLGAALADSGAAPPSGRGTDSELSRLGYFQPRFGSGYGHDGTQPPRPTYVTPDLTSPDFGGPEQRPE